MTRVLERVFFSQTPLQCARQLLGASLLWDGFEAKIVETEAYGAVGDPACHTFTRPSAREFVTKHPPGTAYVYLNYGVHWLFNVLVKGGAEDGFVLFRALEIERIPPAREGWVFDARCCAGPGKLTRILGITGEHHGMDLCSGRERCFQFPVQPDRRLIQETPRIGISRGQDLLWRFVLQGSESLSGSKPAKRQSKKVRRLF